MAGINVNVPTWFIQQYRVKQLSDGAFATWVKLAGWCVANYKEPVFNNGKFPQNLAEIETHISREGLNELFQAGFIKTVESGTMLLADYAQTQSSVAQLERSVEGKRAYDREYRRKEREGEKAGKREEPSNDTSNYWSATVPGGIEQNTLPRTESYDGSTNVVRQSSDNRTTKVRKSDEVSKVKALDEGKLEPSKKSSESYAGWSGSFSALPNDADVVTGEMPPAGAPRSCAEPGCDTAPFGNQPLCFAHNQQKIKGAA